MSERSAFDEYLFGGGLERDAAKGVAQAIADLKAAGITPAHNPAITPTAPVPRHGDVMSADANSGPELGHEESE